MITRTSFTPLRRASVSSRCGFGAASCSSETATAANTSDRDTAPTGTSEADSRETRSSPCPTSSPPAASSPDAASDPAGQHQPDPPERFPACVRSGTAPRNRRRTEPARPAARTAAARSGPARSGRCWPAAARSRRPAGSPPALLRTAPSSITPAFSHCRISFNTLRSEIRRSTISISRSCRCCQSSLECRHRRRGCAPGWPLRGWLPAPAWRSASAGIRRTAGMEVRLEDRLDHDLRRHLHHPVPHRRNAQWPLLSIRFRYVPPLHREGRYGLPADRPGSPQEPSDPRCSMAWIVSPSTPAAPRCSAPASTLPQNVTPVDPVVQRMETASLTLLGHTHSVALELSYF